MLRLRRDVWILYISGLRLMVGNVVRSLWSGGGNTLTRGKNEVFPAVGGKYMQKKERKIGVHPHIYGCSRIFRGPPLF